MIDLQNIKLIIWDWNGTLLNDVEVCVEAMNVLLAERKLPVLTADRYRDIFTFPVMDYYQKLGFDFEQEPFETPALQFMDLYRDRVGGSVLQENAVVLLDFFSKNGIRQVILSAMEQELLNQLLGHFNIRHFFEACYGIDNHLGGGKIARGLELIDQMKLQAYDCMMFGDTLHDVEVAKTLGCSCSLFTEGHQSEGVLVSSGLPLIHRYSDLLACF